MAIKLNGDKSFLWQWDTNQYLEVGSGAAQVHFKVNAQTALAVDVIDGRARIPDTLLQRPGRQICYVYNDNATIESMQYDVKQRPKPSDYIYTEDEKATWTELDERIKALEEGIISSVAGVQPNPDGNVPLTAKDINALPTSGGTMTGGINMNGQPLRGLNDPTADDQPVNKGYLDHMFVVVYPNAGSHNSVYRGKILELL